MFSHTHDIYTKLQNLFLLSVCVLLTTSSLPVLASSVEQHQTGTKYSPLNQINTENVKTLTKAWEFHTGDLPEDYSKGLVSFQDQPSLIDGNLVICTPGRQVIALDPETGKQRWAFDPQGLKPNSQKCRGIGAWVDKQADQNSQCRSRIFLGTFDYTLVAIDASTGKPCEDFGKHGVVQLPTDKPQKWPGEVVATSNPAVVNDVVVVGSAVADQQRMDAPSGRVMAVDARSGKLLWQFDPVPRDSNDQAMSSWGKGTKDFGQGNVWSSMAVDPDLDLVYLPTTSTSDDYFGGNRPGDNHYTTSVVALRGKTGEVVWHQQLVHHNVWDYDLPSRPTLIDYPSNGKSVPALVQNTKMGLVFIFNRVTGEPLVPIEERPVPQAGAIEGEVLSPTQPFPVGMPALTVQHFSPDDAWGFTPIDRWLCKRKIEQYNYGPIYTPISSKGTIVTPSVGGGSNWGGGAYSPDSHIMVVAVSHVPTVLSLMERSEAPEVHGMQLEGTSMMFENPGSKYVASLKPLLSPLGAPCSAPPWATLTAIDIVKKEIVWNVPLGSIHKLAHLPFDVNFGTPSAGGALVTAGGLAFIGYSSDDRFRAFDLKSGEVLWQYDLPAGGTSMPVSYEINGVQYIVVPSGGHSLFLTGMGDSVVAFKLER